MDFNKVDSHCSPKNHVNSFIHFSSYHCYCSVSKSCLLFATPWAAASQAPLSFTISQILLKFMSIELSILFNHLILCHPLLLLPSISPIIRVFSNELAFHIRWPKYWSFSFSINSANEQSGLISFRMTGLISLQSKRLSRVFLQHHSLKASILRCSAFSTVKLSHPDTTTRKTIALSIQTFVGKIMSLLCNMLSGFVCFLIHCLVLSQLSF